MFTAVLCAIALVLLWFRGKSILDQWLAIAMFAALLEMLMVGFFLGRRFDLGWYAVRIFGVIAATAVLLALLAETMNLYAKLARSNPSVETRTRCSPCDCRSGYWCYGPRNETAARRNRRFRRGGSIMAEAHAAGAERG
jgi:hypothetical protein